MKNLVTIILFSLILSACGTSYQSKPEALFNLNEQKRWGLITKEEHQDKLQAIKHSALPEQTLKPIDYQEIRQHYQHKAEGNQLAALTQQYNTGEIDQQTFNIRVEALNKAKQQQALKTLSLASAVLTLGLAESSNASHSGTAYLTELYGDSRINKL